jgi:ADP-heptose:LPS heptosyltransferase
LILQLDRIGDAVWVLYFIKIIKNNFKDLKISIICNDYNKFIFDAEKNLFENIYVLYEKPQ